MSRVICAKICSRKETVYKTINPISVHRKHLLVNSFFSSISASYPVRFKASLLVKGLTSSLPQQIKMHTASLSSRVRSEVFKVGRRTRRIIKTRTYSHLYTKETTDRLTEGKYSLASPSSSSTFWSRIFFSLSSFSSFFSCALKHVHLYNFHLTKTPTLNSKMAKVAGSSLLSETAKSVLYSRIPKGVHRLDVF